MILPVSGRGPLTRRLPVFWQAAPEPLPVRPYVVTPGMTPRQFFLRVIFSVKRLTVPGALCATLLMVAQSLVPVIVGVAIDRAPATSDPSQLLLWLVVLAVNFLVIATCSRFGQQLMIHAAQIAQLRLPQLVLDARVMQDAFIPVSMSASLVRRTGRTPATRAR